MTNTTTKTNKVWAFNCFGVCIALIAADKVDDWNETHPLFNEKIISTKPY